MGRVGKVLGVGLVNRMVFLMILGMEDYNTQ